MDTKVGLYALFAIALVLIIAYAAMAGFSGSRSGKTLLAVQLTDPPSVPQGTQHLLVSYSSVEVHVSGQNQSGWVATQGSGTVDLMTLQNVSQTIANAYVQANATINTVRFNITSAKIIINGTTYNATPPSSQVTVAITGEEKINSSVAVLIDFAPMVNSHPSGNARAYILVPAAKAIVVNANSSISVSTMVGARSSIGADVMARLGVGTGGICIGVGGGPCGGGGGGIESLVIVGSGQRISNFMVENVNYSSGTVSGLLYIQYPVASNIGESATIRINDTVGYACDNTQYRLVNLYVNGTASFAHDESNATAGGCPI